MWEEVVVPQCSRNPAAVHSCRGPEQSGQPKTKSFPSWATAYTAFVARRRTQAIDVVTFSKLVGPSDSRVSIKTRRHQQLRDLIHLGLGGALPDQLVQHR